MISLSSKARSKIASNLASLGIDAKYSPKGTTKTPFKAMPDEAYKPIEKYVSQRLFPHDSVNQESEEYDPQKTRIDRFVLQSASRRLLHKSTIKRINNCLRVPTGLPEDIHDSLAYMDKPSVRVYHSLDHGSCSFGGLQTCASVWVCAVCAAKISERRKNEIQKAIEQHKNCGGDILLLTLTTPHYDSDKLSHVLGYQKDALKYFNQGGDLKKFNDYSCYLGQIRALEVTHGRLRQRSNGWHPHYHILLFVREGLDLHVVKGFYYQKWLKACIRADMPSLPDYKHGVRVDNGSKAAAYASKWGLESEMTKGHIKKSKDGETPFDLLRAYSFDDDKQAGALFREFAECFKGKRQLHWSSRLKENFMLEDVSDDELASKQDDYALLLGRIELDDWRLVLRADCRGELLELARHGWDRVEGLLKNLREYYEIN